ncbi:hypothetical protein [Pelagibius marinus]|uniref:hypothetical protein n=1 Tax=Pelagibius marinus TaxID=2762760 RepID=UPI001872FF67|nr:hypothetical protein [Pelagibius marinus]
MTSQQSLACLAIAAGLGLGGMILSTAAAGTAGTAIEKMPADLETRFALSAAPAHIRAEATVYLLDPAKGYEVAKEGSNGVACMVSRTAWEQAEYRNDIYVPLCYDAAGVETYFKVLMDVAALRIEGLAPEALKAEIEARYGNGTYTAPEQPGLSYMVAPVLRTWMLPDMKVHTRPMPHLMFYAPNLTDKDIAANLAADVSYPFIFAEGHPAQSYMIQVVGSAESEAILTAEKDLLDKLCAYRDVLCVEER